MDMDTDKSSTTCSNCGAVMPQEHASAAEREPCAHCGSTARTFHENVAVVVKCHSMLRAKHKRPGFKKPICECVSGADRFRATGQWFDLARTIDRENNRYREIIVNPETGEVIRECDEPLTDHVGRGSAKRKPTA